MMQPEFEVARGALYSHKLWCHYCHDYVPRAKWKMHGICAFCPDHRIKLRTRLSSKAKRYALHEGKDSRPIIEVDSSAYDDSKG